MAIKGDPTVRGKFAAYLIETGPPSGGEFHGLTDWCDTKAGLWEWINMNFPGASMPDNQEELKGSGTAQAAGSPPEAAVAPKSDQTEEPTAEFSEKSEANEGPKDEEGEEDGDEWGDWEGETKTTVAWLGTFERLCVDQNYHAQVVRLRFFEDYNQDHRDERVRFSYGDSDLVPPVAEALRDAFDEWLVSGELSFF